MSPAIFANIPYTKRQSRMTIAQRERCPFRCTIRICQFYMYELIFMHLSEECRLCKLTRRQACLPVRNRIQMSRIHIGNTSLSIPSYISVSVCRCCLTTRARCLFAAGRTQREHCVWKKERERDPCLPFALFSTFDSLRDAKRIASRGNKNAHAHVLARYVTCACVQERLRRLT